MSAKTVSIEKLLAKADEAPERRPMPELSIERLAVDLLRHMIQTLRVKTVRIPKSTLPENEYPSSSFINDVARPIVLYSMALRDRLRIRFAEFSVFHEKAVDQDKAEDEGKADDKDKTEGTEKPEDEMAKRKDEDKAKDQTEDADKTEHKTAGDDDKTEDDKTAGDDEIEEDKTAGNEEKTKDDKTAGNEEKTEDEDKAEYDVNEAERAEIENDLISLFDVLNTAQVVDIYKQFIMTVVLASELSQYLGSKNKADLVKHVPGAWATLFETRISEELKLAGGFEEYLSYWAFMGSLEHHILKFVKNFTPYEAEASLRFKAHLTNLEAFRAEEVMKKILHYESKDPVTKPIGEDYFKIVDLYGFYPHERLLEVPGSQQATGSAEGRDNSRPGTCASKTASSKSASSAKNSGTRAKKLKAKPGQTYSRFVSERRAALREAQQQEQELDRLADNLEEAGQLSESDEEEGS